MEVRFQESRSLDGADLGRLLDKLAKDKIFLCSRHAEDLAAAETTPEASLLQCMQLLTYNRRSPEIYTQDERQAVSDSVLMVVVAAETGGHCTSLKPQG
ncbi:hypothetical protein HPP92_028939 [Vanilla planifolia]|uniref:Uncharacterized protein n=1 Tax=Vanilla planifolia TaxID=51239 RepID=A0A835P659_VANPL|nr:hypothetical protein HPP92_028929 [Vanilla planifolia]KAG0446236.1 hypothetical protein HPP92_028939 [Vanilla planifolia]